MPKPKREGQTWTIAEMIDGTKIVAELTSFYADGGRHQIYALIAKSGNQSEIIDTYKGDLEAIGMAMMHAIENTGILENVSPHSAARQIAKGAKRMAKQWEADKADDQETYDFAASMGLPTHIFDNPLIKKQ